MFIKPKPFHANCAELLSLKNNLQDHQMKKEMDSQEAFVSKHKSKSFVMLV